MIHLRRADLPVSLWRNGAGRKADIAAGPFWHIGFAFLDGDAPFSNYAGHDRTITLVDGPGFTLSNPDITLAVTTPGAPTSFDGGWPLGCRIHGGPCIVVNAMTARAHHSHTVTRFHGGPIAPGGATSEVLVVIHGELRLDDLTAGAQDAIVLTRPARAAVSRGACVVRLSITPA